MSYVFLRIVVPNIHPVDFINSKLPTWRLYLLHGQMADSQNDYTMESGWQGWVFVCFMSRCIICSIYISLATREHEVERKKKHVFHHSGQSLHSHCHWDVRCVWLRDHHRTQPADYNMKMGVLVPFIFFFFASKDWCVQSSAWGNSAAVFSTISI